MENVDQINPRKEALLELIHIATQHISGSGFSLPRHLCGCQFSCLQLWLSPHYLKTVHWLLSEEQISYHSWIWYIKYNCYSTKTQCELLQLTYMLCWTSKSLTSSIKTHILITWLIAFTFGISIFDGDIKFKQCWLEQWWHDHTHVRQRLLTQAFVQPDPSICATWPMHRKKRGVQWDNLEDTCRNWRMYRKIIAAIPSPWWSTHQ